MTRPTFNFWEAVDHVKALLILGPPRDDEGSCHYCGREIHGQTPMEGHSADCAFLRAGAFVDKVERS